MWYSEIDQYQDNIVFVDVSHFLNTYHRYDYSNGYRARFIKIMYQIKNLVKYHPATIIAISVPRHANREDDLLLWEDLDLLWRSAADDHQYINDNYIKCVDGMMVFTACLH